MDMPTVVTVMVKKAKGHGTAWMATAVVCCHWSIALAQQSSPVITPITNTTGQSVAGASSIPNTGFRAADANQEPGAARAWTIVPRIGITETLTDNVNLSSTNKQSDLVSQISPGIRIDARTARLKMYFDYALNGLIYARESGNNNIQNSLNTFGTLEAIDNWMFIDFSGQIAQQTISPFGVQSPSNAYINNNTTETSSYRVSPYIRGQLIGSADYYLRYNQSYTNSGYSAASNIDLSQWLGQIKGNTTFQNLNWAIDGSQQKTDYSQGRDYEDQRIRAMLIYKLFPEFRASLSGGYESNNYQSLDMEGQTTNGYGFDWTPTERTQVSGFQERRFFGNGHNFVLSHRFPLSSIRYTDIRDVAFLPGQFGQTGQGTIYDQYFEQFATLIPDPVARAAFVTSLLNQAGIAPNAQAVNDYLTNRPQVRRTQQLSVVFFGSRNSITFLASRSENQAVTLVGGLNGAISQDSRVEQQGYTVNFSHRLNELTGLNALVSRQESQSGTTSALDTTLTTYQVSVTRRLGAKTAGALTARRNEFASNTSPYDENALVATLTMSF
jgi:uncharacterized protein (PEP-CTERM system associated)